MQRDEVQKLCERLNAEGELLAQQPELGDAFRTGTAIFEAATALASLAARCAELEHGAEYGNRKIDALTAENERLRAALGWMDNLDPQLVEAARQKFGLPDA